MSHVQMFALVRVIETESEGGHSELMVGQRHRLEAVIDLACYA